MKRVVEIRRGRKSAVVEGEDAVQVAAQVEALRLILHRHLAVVVVGPAAAHLRHPILVGVKVDLVVIGEGAAGVTALPVVVVVTHLAHDQIVVIKSQGPKEEEIERGIHHLPVKSRRRALPVRVYHDHHLDQAGVTKSLERRNRKTHLEVLVGVYRSLLLEQQRNKRMRIPHLLKDHLQ